MTDSEGGVTTYGYNANGRLTSLTNPKGQTITFTYDAASRRAAT
jgi:YD repeat-containing protein